MTLDEVFPRSKNKDKGKNFQVLELGVPKRTSSKFKLLCTICDSIVEMKPVKVFAGQKGCKCSTMYYRNSSRRLERLLDTLSSKDIKPTNIPENLRWYHYIDLECNSCKYIWSTQENSIVNYAAGCPNCAGVRKFTEQEVIDKLDSLIEMSKVSNYTLINPNWTSGEVQCWCKCGHIRTTSPMSLFNEPDSCAGCSTSGFKPTEPATLYLLELKNSSGSLVGYKYGIAANIDQRHQKISRHFNGTISVWCSWDYSFGYLAQKHENVFKKAFKSLLNKEQLKDGWTETFDPQYLSCFLTLQKIQYAGL